MIRTARRAGELFSIDSMRLGGLSLKPRATETDAGAMGSDFMVLEAYTVNNLHDQNIPSPSPESHSNSEVYTPSALVTTSPAFENFPLGNSTRAIFSASRY